MQTFLMLLGIAVGVAVVVAIDLATSSARSSLEQANAALGGRATHVVTGLADRGPSVALYRRLRLEHGRRDIAPIIEGWVTLLTTRPAPLSQRVAPRRGPSGAAASTRAARPQQAMEPPRAPPGVEQRPMQVLGVDPFAEAPFRDWLAFGRTRSSVRTTGEALASFFTVPCGVLVSSRLAAREGWEVGSRLQVHAAGRRVGVTVVGLIEPTSAGTAEAMESLLVCDLAAAQEILATGDRLTRLDVRLEGAGEVAALASLLPAEVRLAPQGERTAGLQQMTAAFELNLTAISLLTLVIGVFLVYNTVTFFVVQRRPVLGILRALGATRGQIFSMVLVETLLFAALGSVAGIALGVLLGKGALHLVSRTINDLYYTLPSSRFEVRWIGLLKGLGAGVGAGLLAAAVPAAEAARVAPVGAMRVSDLEEKARRLLLAVTLVGLLGLLAGGVALAWPGETLGAGFVGLVLCLVGSAALAPACTVLAMAGLEPVTVRCFGIVGRLAPRAIARSLSRTGVAVAALMLSVSAIIGVQIMVGSFRVTFVDWLDGTLGADLFVSSPYNALSHSDAFGPEVAAALARVPGVRRVASESHFTLDSPRYRLVHVVGVSHDITRRRRFAWHDGSCTSQPAVQAGLDAGDVLVSQPFARRHHLPLLPGTSIELPTAQGVRLFRVRGVYYDYGSERGTVLMGRAAYLRAFPGSRTTGLAAFAEPGEPADAMCERVRRALAAKYDLLVVSNRALRDQAIQIFERTFAITSALRVLVAVVAFIGVLSSLLALMLERRREVATLRALGLTARQVQHMALLETLLLSVAAGVLALPVGTGLAGILVAVINPRSFGWTMAFVPQAGYYVEALALALGAGMLAGAYPAWRFAQSASPRDLELE